MEIKESRFIKSSSALEQCPPPNKAEFAFIGRSNVGKSSLINMLTGRKSLAKISSKPGKTQLINHFEIDGSWYLVDLPGYGWSKVSKQKKADWGVMIEEYLLKRETLACLFVLIDSRLEPQIIDYEFITWLGEQEIPFAMVFTKTDKQSKNKFQSIKAKHLRQLKNAWEEIPILFESSAIDQTGKKEILSFAEEIISDFRK
ncbi:MAG: YihA family ribosome biogenesis GTP-binding protein [Cyclobacteriaceae bacterium]|nr:YihA family ribosome biogenesis GTP-binding protein [Cyclobacteriaceae bacterium]